MGSPKSTRRWSKLKLAYSLGFLTIVELAIVTIWFFALGPVAAIKGWQGFGSLMLVSAFATSLALEPVLVLGERWLDVRLMSGCHDSPRRVFLFGVVGGVFASAIVGIVVAGIAHSVDVSKWPFWGLIVLSCVVLLAATIAGVMLSGVVLRQR